MRTVITILLASAFGASLLLIGHSLGQARAYFELMDRDKKCEKEVAVIPSSEVCLYHGYKESCKGLRPRIVYTYHSHKFMSCLYGKKGPAWAR